MNGFSKYEGTGNLYSEIYTGYDLRIKTLLQLSQPKRIVCLAMSLNQIVPWTVFALVFVWIMRKRNSSSNRNSLY